jgi:hypothetical protein
MILDIIWALQMTGHYWQRSKEMPLVIYFSGELLGTNLVDTPELFFLTNNLKMKSSKNLTIIDWIFTNKPQYYGLIPGCGFPTGIFLFIVFSAMYIFSVKYVRKGGYFEVHTLKSLIVKYGILIHNYFLKYFLFFF